jgi:hypothetical protein
MSNISPKLIDVENNRVGSDDVYKINILDMYNHKNILTSTQDRLIEDETRRRQGEFFTPTIWVDEAHKMISEQFGEDWKEEYIVWDCASGTGNLTRDYKFKELYCSTLLASDIETMEQAGYNPNATKFQYDFLNDGFNDDDEIDIANDPKLPQGLKDAILEGKEILILMNPPYGTANDAGAKGTHKGGISLTKTNVSMKNEDWGSASQQLYAQFLYKLVKIQEINKNVKICLFSPPLLLSGSSYKKFRNKFFNHFNFKNGFLMNASEFQDTSEWGLSFSLWGNEECLDKNNFNYTVKISNDLKIVNIKNKNIYNVDNQNSFSNYIKRNIKKEKTFDAPQLSSALNVKQKGYGTLANNAMGFYMNASNNIMENVSGVYILSTPSSKGHGISIFPINYLDVIVNFLARKSIKSNWINQKDEYIAPSEEIQQTPKYKQFNNDAIVYSLFNTSSNQSSMRQVEYKDKLWDIKNEFFWMSKDEMLQLSDEYKFDELYKDSKMSDDRYVYNLLKTTKLSPDAKELLEMSKDLIRKSFEWRKIIHKTNPEYHLDAWDAGWYQIKKILNEHFKKELDIFIFKYKKFEERLRPQVYHLGFLNDDNRDYDEEYQKELKTLKINSLLNC